MLGICQSGGAACFCHYCRGLLCVFQYTYCICARVSRQCCSADECAQLRESLNCSRCSSRTVTSCAWWLLKLLLCVLFFCNLCMFREKYSFDIQYSEFVWVEVVAPTHTPNSLAAAQFDLCGKWMQPCLSPPQGWKQKIAKNRLGSKIEALSARFLHVERARARQLTAAPCPVAYFPQKMRCTFKSSPAFGVWNIELNELGDKLTEDSQYRFSCFNVELFFLFFFVFSLWLSVLFLIIHLLIYHFLLYSFHMIVDSSFRHTTFTQQLKEKEKKSKPNNRNEYIEPSEKTNNLN